MKKLAIGLIFLMTPALSFAEKAKEEASPTSWANKMNTPFFVKAAEDKTDYDGLRNTVKMNVEKFLSDNGYRSKVASDGGEFVIEVKKIPSKDKTVIQIYDESTGEVVVASTEDDKGKETLRKFTDAMKAWDKNGTIYRVIFQDMSFTETQAIKEKFSAEPNYGGQWQTANDSVLITFKGTSDAFIEAVVRSAGNTIEPAAVVGRKVIFRTAKAKEVKKAEK